MNNVNLTGRLVMKPELNKTTTGISMTKYRLAVKSPRNSNETDFINCVSFSKNADFMTMYCDKGDMIAIAGYIQTGSYERNGEKVYTTDIITNRVEKLSSPKQDDRSNYIPPEEYYDEGNY